MRRVAPVQPVSEVLEGDLLIGLGVGWSAGASYALSGFSGNEWSLGDVALGYGLGPRALIRIDGAIWRLLDITERTDPSIPLDPDTDDGTTVDKGDFRVTASFAPLGSSAGLSGGAIVEVKLPNTSEGRGVGSNTTDVMLGFLGSWGSDRWRATSRLGIAILEVPLTSFDQNDLIAYALDVIYRASPKVRLFAGVEGMANTRTVVPLGTEDRGTVGGGIEFREGDWRFDLQSDAGFAGHSSDWTIAAGVAWAHTRGARPGRE